MNINVAELGMLGPDGLGGLDQYSAPNIFAAAIPAGGGGDGPGKMKGGKKKKDDDNDESYTTIMLRNIPNKYTRQMLLDQLYRAGFRGDIDYLYLPTDFANRCNVGYCFISTRTALARQRFCNSFDGVAAQTCLPGFNSYKVCQVTKAKWQGRDENIRRLRSGPELMAQLSANPEWLPLLLDEHGNEEPFPSDDASLPVQGNGMSARRQRNIDGGMARGGAGRGRGGRKGGRGQGPAFPAYADPSVQAAMGGMPYMMPMVSDVGLGYMHMPMMPGMHMPDQAMMGMGAYPNPYGAFDPYGLGAHGAGMHGGDFENFGVPKQQKPRKGGRGRGAMGEPQNVAEPDMGETLGVM